jgi:hypothetical protein
VRRRRRLRDVRRWLPGRSSSPARSPCY